MSIVVLGSANLDLVVRQTRRPAPGETVFGSAFSTGPGGKGLNQAIAAVRAGASVAFVGAVGADEFGGRLRGALADAGVDVSLLRETDASTGVAAISVTDDGENAIVVVPGANASHELTDADRAAVTAASYLMVQLERPVSLVRDAMTAARAHGVTTVLTPSPASRGIDDILALADIVIANEGEARLLAAGEPETVEDAARSLSERGTTVVVTLGARGALVAREGVLSAQAQAHPASAVDTTGAGDTFAGVLVAWLARGEDFEHALHAASAAASIAVTRSGAADSTPDADEIRAALAARPA